MPTDRVALCEQARALIFDYRQAGLSDADSALCEYAVKLTLTPTACGQLDVQRLREHGFSDVSITLAAQVVGYFNYINRIAEGLGVDPEDWMPGVVTREEWESGERGHRDLRSLGEEGSCR